MSDLPICIELKPQQTFVISKKNLMADGRHFNIDKSAYASEAHQPLVAEKKESIHEADLGYGRASHSDDLQSVKQKEEEK